MSRSLVPSVTSTFHWLLARKAGRFCRSAFPAWSTRKTMSSATSDNVDLASFDATQVKLLEEMCILVDEADQVIGSESKKACHLVSNIDGPRHLLHRAFSVFLFSGGGGGGGDDYRLLLQQRSDEKITFPGQWTNSCCSHPLWREDERSGVAGVKRAARRRLSYELGLREGAIALDAMTYITRIHYKAPSDGLWAEHEIDYVIFAKLPEGARLDVNRNEVKHHKYVTPAELRRMLDDGVPLTPWFKLICNSKLFHWWDGIDSLEKFQDHERIHKM